MARGNNNRSAGSTPGTLTSQIGILGRITFVLIMLAAAGMVAGSTSAAPFAFVEQVKQFFGVASPQAAAPLLEAAAPLPLDPGTTAPESMDPAAMMPAGSLLTPPMTGAVVGCNLINVSWINAN